MFVAFDIITQITFFGLRVFFIDSRNKMTEPSDIFVKRFQLILLIFFRLKLSEILLKVLLTKIGL